MIISFVWAEDKNHIIGKDGTLPWSMPNDLKHFRNVTAHHTIVMGRKTYESFPNGPLPNRLNIVISRNTKYEVPESVVLLSDKNKLSNYVKDDEEVMVIGGAGIFEMFKNEVDRLYLTKIDHEFDGDVKMIDLNYDDFKLIGKKEGVVDDKNIYPYTFETYDKI
ncbi:dihydrofolate reductase [Companilactobacillus insicii]|uniref:dihydrofolate reductase n=1 Tax=Companilactobacillus insicii TaxID=1732567 RepID=UPI001FE4470F|nr:dihydrofolate reductase [Companilactobacillus insicii]